MKKLAGLMVFNTSSIKVQESYGRWLLSKALPYLEHSLLSGGVRPTRIKSLPGMVRASPMQQV
ncbi:MAG: hypothetical protein NT040_04260 [Bacteroidetes bacterium]|nr:hypothetical protein [Bacteroidota bacterium]